MKTEQILGIRFFDGTAAEAAREMSERGGLLVAPSGTCFERLGRDERYREAITSADLALPDSGFMVLLWRFLRGRSIHRVSGLAYLKALVSLPPFSRTHALWVLPNERAREKLLAWSATKGLVVSESDCYVAPIYGAMVSDEVLLDFVIERKPEHVVIGLGAGAQEKLGWFLREGAKHKPAIHCIGGALGFLTGDQVGIPDWADRFYLGWFLRLLSRPQVFVPRLWKARGLPWWIWKYGPTSPVDQNREKDSVAG